MCILKELPMSYYSSHFVLVDRHFLPALNILLNKLAILENITKPVFYVVLALCGPMSGGLLELWSRGPTDDEFR